MSRTNKMGILRQKQQAAKQKKMMQDAVSVIQQDGIKYEYTNPKGNTYVFFKRSGKWICDITNCREDPDGYRLVGRPNSGEVDHVYNIGSWGYRRFLKKFTKGNISKK